MTAIQPAAVRRRVAAWLAEEPTGTAIALRAPAEWVQEPTFTVDGKTVRVVACPTPLAMRVAIHDRAADEKLVLLTELGAAELGDGLLAHLSRQRIRSIDAWELVRQMFGGVELDPTLVRAGRWIADALGDYAPPGGWPPPPGLLLTREYALRGLAGQLLGLPREEIDNAGLLQWTTRAQSLYAYSKLPSPVLDGMSAYLADAAGPAAVPLLAAVRAGHGVDVIPLALLVGALWPSGATGSVSTAVAVARTRLEPRFGGVRLLDGQATAFRDAAEAWVDRVLSSGSEADRAEVRRMMTRAEEIAVEIDATDLLGSSPILPSGFTHRLRSFAQTLRLAIPAGPVADAAALAYVERELLRLEDHRSSDAHRVDTAHMAVRLLRWLAAPDAPAAPTLLDAVYRQVRDDGWVDRARLDVLHGDVDSHAAEAYRLLYRAVDVRRSRHDQHFATLLADATAAEAQPGSMLRVEDVLERVIRPILDHGRNVLLLVLDGMNVAASTELAEALTRSGAWVELTPAGGPRTGVLAALPTVTAVSRCSLFSGRIVVGEQSAEIAAVSARFPDSLLLHKKALRGTAGAALDPEVVDAIADPGRRLVAAVVNTIDDALDRGDPDTSVWGPDNITPVRDLLAVARHRTVVIVSDHGHVVDRGPDATVRSVGTSTNRWRPDALAAGDGEVAVSGSRVALGGGRVVLPWREELRYGPRKAGYHGGAAPAEAVIPLLVFTAGEDTAVPGWSGAPVASPSWWRDPLSAPAAVASSAPRSTQSRRTAPVQADSLFDMPAKPEPPAAPQPSLVDRLLASPIYAQRRGTRAPLADERVAALVGVLIAGNGRAALDTLAARADVPVHRIRLTVTALRKLLQVEGYPVVDFDADGYTVKLDVGLLVDQFKLGPA